jgi:membrane protease YdiL (CAAX protease family)
MNGMQIDAQTAIQFDVSVALAAGLALAACVGATVFLVHRYRRGVPVVPARPHRPVPWEGGDVLMVLLGFGLVANLAGGVIGPEPPLDVSLAAQLVVVAGTSIIACGWLMARGATVADLGLAPLRPREDATLAVVGLAVVLAPLLALNAWLTTIKPYEHPVIDLLTTNRDAWGIALVIATACIAAPIGEELVFRRILQGWLEKLVPSADGMWAIGIASLAFAAAHAGQGLAYIPLFPLGIVLGWLARRTGSIIPSILLHALFNAVSVALLLAAPPAAR